MAHLKPMTPGELLREEFLVPMGLTQYRVANEIGVPAQRLADLRAHPPICTALPTQASESAAVTKKSATSAREIEPGTGEISARLT